MHVTEWQWLKQFDADEKNKPVHGTEKGGWTSISGYNAQACVIPTLLLKIIRTAE